MDMFRGDPVSSLLSPCMSLPCFTWWKWNYMEHILEMWLLSLMIFFIYYLFAFHFHSFVVVHHLNLFQSLYPFFCGWIVWLKPLSTFLPESLWGRRHSLVLSAYLGVAFWVYRVRFTLSKNDLECSSIWRTAKQIIKMKWNSTFDWRKRN